MTHIKTNNQYFIIFSLWAIMVIVLSGCRHTDKTPDLNTAFKPELNEVKTNTGLSRDTPQKDHIALAKQLIEKGYYDVALVQLDTALKEKSNRSAGLFYLMGVCHREKEEYEEAIKSFNLAIDQDKEFSFAYNGLGLTYALTGQPDIARKYFIKAISLNPARADFLNNAGHLEMMEKQYRKAEEYFRKSLLINNRFEQAVNNLAICLGMLGKETEALNLLIKNSHPSKAYYNMGVIYRMKGENEKAEELFQKAEMSVSLTDKVEDDKPVINVPFEEKQREPAFTQKAPEEEVEKEKPEAYSKVSEAAPEKTEDIVPDTKQWASADVDDWKIVDEGDIEGPSSWYISADHLKQSSNIYGGEDSGSIPDKPGTYAIAGSMEWRDYSLEVKLLSHDDDAIGVIFRYIDDDNYYRFSMDSSRSYKRLVKKSREKISILAEDNGNYQKGQQYQAKIIVCDERILVILDDKVLFDIRDRDIERGKIGVYSWGNRGSEFSYPVVRVKP
ncbi:MAG: tetratricopeptide repeat protein [Desulfobacteraceae bacterium]|jgi:Flp pilus assembly protein TadD